MRDRGQAAVEFAIALPLVVVLVVGVVQIAGVVSDQLAVEFAAREGARAAAVSATPAAASRKAATRATHLAPIDVSTTATPARVTVSVSYRSRNGLPLLGLVLREVELSATVEMAREPP